MFYQLLCIIIIAAVAFGNPGQCSVPINVFLQGLFYMYIIAIVLNILMFCVRYFDLKFEGSSSRRQMKNLTLRIELCYFPLY